MLGWYHFLLSKDLLLRGLQWLPNEWHTSDCGQRHVAGNSGGWHFHLTCAQLPFGCWFCQQSGQLLARTTKSAPLLGKFPILRAGALTEFMTPHRAFSYFKEVFWHFVNQSLFKWERGRERLRGREGGRIHVTQPGELTRLLNCTLHFHICKLKFWTRSWAPQSKRTASSCLI